MADDCEYSSLDIRDKLIHKAWKARLMGYEELCRQWKMLGDEDSEWKTGIEIVQRAVLETNVAVLDTAYDAVLLFLGHSGLTAAVTKEVIAPIVEKGLGSSRSSTRQKALEAIRELVFIDRPDPVIEDLVPFLDHKQPKLVIASICALRDIVKTFGISFVNHSRLLAQVPKIFQHPDKAVRDEGSRLCQELYRWIGKEMLPSLETLKPVQIKELHQLFGSVDKENRPVPDRQLKFQMTDKTVDESCIVPECPSVEETEDRVAVLESIPCSFYSMMNSSVWKERKAALEQILPTLKVKRISDGNYFELVGVLARGIDDVNIHVAALAIQCIEYLARGLGPLFANHMDQTMPRLIERLKEKKPAVASALAACLDGVFSGTASVSALVEHMIYGMNHKNPQIRTGTISWLCRSLQRHVPDKELVILCKQLCRAVDDGNSEVRQIGFQAWSDLLKRYGERKLGGFLDKIDKLKLEKIRAMAKEPAKEPLKPAKSTLINGSSIFPESKSLDELSRLEKHLCELESVFSETSLDAAVSSLIDCTRSTGHDVLRVLAMMERVMMLWRQSKVHVSDKHVRSIISWAVPKLGDPKEGIRSRIQGLVFDFLATLCPRLELVAHLTDHLDFANSKAKLEIANGVLRMIRDQGEQICMAFSASGTLVSKWSQIYGCEDGTVKCAVFNMFLEWYRSEIGRTGLEPDQPFKHCPNSQELEDRLKREVRKQCVTPVRSRTARCSESATLRTDRSTSATPKYPSESATTKTYQSRLKTPKTDRSIVALPKARLSVEEVLEMLGSETSLVLLRGISQLELLIGQKHDLSLYLTNIVQRLSEQMDQAFDKSQIHVIGPITTCAVSLFTDRDYLGRMDRTCLQQLAGTVAKCLASAKDSNVSRSLNTLMVKLLELSAPTACFSIFLSLLQDYSLLVVGVPSPKQSHVSVADLLMKCLWRLVKSLGSRLEVCSVDVKQLLIDIHLFLETITPSQWKCEVNTNGPLQDMPLRTIKTILHELASRMGPSILGEARDGLGSAWEKSPVTCYLKHMLEEGCGSRTESKGTESRQLLDDGEIQQQLSGIMEKIADKSGLDRGIEELHQISHPEMVSSFQARVETQSPQLRRYIAQKMLGFQTESEDCENETPRIDYRKRLERYRKLFYETTKSTAQQPDSASLDKIQDSESLAAIRERIAKLRMGSNS